MQLGYRSMGEDKSVSSFPLAFANNGETVYLTEIRAGGRLHQRLIDLGLTIGMSVRVVQCNTNGPMILAVKNDARLAIGRGMAQKIMVSHIGKDM